MTYLPLLVRCVECEHEFELHHEGQIPCPECGFSYSFRDNELEYAYRRKLYQRFGRRFLRNAVLNNNGRLSYQLLPEGSVSTSDRSDVVRFKQFMETRVVGTTILDLGCGPAPLPSYLAFVKSDGRVLVWMGDRSLRQRISAAGPQRSTRRRRRACYRA